MPETRRSEGEWVETTLGELTDEQNVRVGSQRPAPVVLSSTKHYGLVPSDEYFKNRTIYSDDLTNYKRVLREWFAYATNHLAEGSIGRQKRFDESCVSPIYTVFSCSYGVHPPYLERVVKSDSVVEQYKTHEQATVDRRGAVRYRDFARVRVHLPPLIQQVKIAEVLDTLDTTIRNTEAIIDKLNRVRQGLLHDLLTRGIDDNGELRAPQSQAPHLYKDSPLGWIPRAWDLVSAGSRCSVITKGATPAADDMWQGDEGVRFLRVDNLTFDGKFDFEASKFRVGSRTHRTTLRRSMCLPGDVLTNIVGPPLGKLGLVTSESGEVNINQAIALFRPNDDLLPRFLLLWLGSAIAQSWLRKRAKQTSGQVNLTLALCQELPLPHVEPAEQQSIVVYHDAAQGRIDLESHELAKLVELKSGLMDDLLTGRVRVTPLLA